MLPGEVAATSEGGEDCAGTVLRVFVVVRADVPLPSAVRHRREESCVSGSGRPEAGNTQMGRNAPAFADPRPLVQFPVAMPTPPDPVLAVPHHLRQPPSPILGALRPSDAREQSAPSQVRVADHRRIDLFEFAFALPAMELDGRSRPRPRTFLADSGAREDREDLVERKDAVRRAEGTGRAALRADEVLRAVLARRDWGREAGGRRDGGGRRDSGSRSGGRRNALRSGRRARCLRGRTS